MNVPQKENQSSQEPLLNTEENGSITQMPIQVDTPVPHGLIQTLITPKICVSKTLDVEPLLGLHVVMVEEVGNSNTELELLHLIPTIDIGMIRTEIGENKLGFGS